MPDYSVRVTVARVKNSRRSPSWSSSRLAVLRLTPHISPSRTSLASWGPRLRLVTSTSANLSLSRITRAKAGTAKRPLVTSPPQMTSVLVVLKTARTTSRPRSVSTTSGASKPLRPSLTSSAAGGRVYVVLCDGTDTRADHAHRHFISIESLETIDN